MEFVLTNKQKTNQFSHIFKNLKNISTDVEMHVKSSGIYIQGMDSGHVCLFELELKDFWFDDFKFEGENLALGINCELIHKVINCKEEHQNISLKTETGDKLFVKLYPREGQTGITKLFELPLIDIDCELLEVPDVDYDADIEIVSQDLANLISQLSLFGRDLNVKCGENIVFKGSGELGNMSAIMEEEQICLYAIAEDTEVDLTYNMDYLSKMVSFAKLNSVAKLHFGKEYPMKLQYDLDFVMDQEDDEEEVKNYIRFFLAPKIEDS
tara:strand:- start:4690 stop:5493 length:804 start_codon:yes stop_codon:yes gene_type:complete